MVRNATRLVVAAASADVVVDGRKNNCRVDCGRLLCKVNDAPLLGLYLLLLMMHPIYCFEFRDLLDLSEWNFSLVLITSNLSKKKQKKQ